MREIGVRKMKSSLSGVPAADRAGERRVRELVASGRVTPAARALPSRSPRPLPGKRSATSIVLAER